MSESNALAPPTKEQVNDLIEFGLALEYLLPPAYHDHPMITVVAALLNSTIRASLSLPPVNVSETVLPVLGPEGASKAPQMVGLLGYYFTIAPTDDMRSKQFTAEYILTFAMAIAMALRIHARINITREFRSYDWLAVVAMMLSGGLAFCALFSLYNFNGGRHIWHVPLNDLKNIIKITIAGGFNYHIGVHVVKVSFLLFYIHLNPNQTFRRICYTCIVIVIMYGFSGLFTISFGCKPFDFWNHPFTVKCVNRSVMYTTKGALESVMDLVIWILPIPVVWRLKFPPRQKVMIMVIFGVGLAICITSFTRLFQIDRFVNGKDFTYDQADAVIWSVAELNIGIIVSCVPGVKAFLTHYAPSLLGSRHSDQSNDTMELANDQNEAKPNAPWRRPISFFVGSASLFASTMRSKGSSFDAEGEHSDDKQMRSSVHGVMLPSSASEEEIPPPSTAKLSADGVFFKDVNSAV